MDIVIKIGRAEHRDFMNNITCLIHLLPTVLNEGIGMMFFENELRAINVKLLSKVFKADKKEYKLTLRPSESFVLYNLIQCIPDEVFSNPLMMRTILGTLDQKTVRYRIANQLSINND